MKNAESSIKFSPSLRKVFSIAEAFRQSRILLSAVELDIFSILGSSSLSYQEVSLRAKSNLRATRILLDALVALGLLRKKRALYSNTSNGRRYLSRQSDEYRGAFLVHIARFWEAWHHLTDVIKSGKPVTPKKSYNAAAFAWAMYHSSQERPTEVVERLNLSSIGSILDLGGGPGHYASAFARRYPDCECVVFDQPDILKVTQEILSKQKDIQSRVKYLAGNFLVDEIGSDYDLILASNVLHSYGDDDVRLIIDKAAKALAPGGRLVIHDFLLDESMSEPEEAAVFSVHMLVLTEFGRAYSSKELLQWIRDSGLEQCKTINLTGGTSLLVGRRLI